jgi:hypothetical protein
VSSLQENNAALFLHNKARLHPRILSHVHQLPAFITVQVRGSTDYMKKLSDHPRRPAAASGPIQVFPGVEQLGCDVDCPSLSTANSKNESTYAYNLSVCLHGVDRKNFTFFLYLFLKVSDFHSSYRSNDGFLLGFSTIWWLNVLTFWRNILPPSVK